MKYILMIAYPFRFLGHPMRRMLETMTTVNNPSQYSSVSLLVEQPIIKNEDSLMKQIYIFFLSDIIVAEKFN